MSGIRVRALAKSYGRTRVLHGVDLDVQPGEVLGLIGPNGAGKTTLMSCIIGFLHPEGGEVTIDDRAADDLGVRRRTGFVPERMNFDRRATGRAFLRYMAKLAQVPRAGLDARVDALLERLDLAGAGKRLLGHYSRGMLQRIGMCQALVRDPDFLFLDEPTSGLDPNGVFLVRDLIAEQKQRGAAVLLNSHQLAEVEKVCDRVVFLDKGLIARNETLRDATKINIAVTLLSGEVVAATVSSDEEIAQLVAQLVGQGAGVVDVRRRTADLESIFRGNA
jgi:ABC-2 type transport system ATP-binding protein